MEQEKVFNFLNKYKNYLVIIHQKPDGDCVASSLAIKLYLENLKKNCQIVLVDRLYEKYQILPGADEIKEVENVQKFLKQNRFQAVIAIDCGALALSGIDRKILAKYPILNIDHHPIKELFGDINYVFPQAAATSEILYDLFKLWKIRLDRKMATLLFTGILTDTGGFKHSNTDLAVLKKAADLQKHGINIAKLTKSLFNTRSIASLKILGMVLSRIKINKKYRIIYSLITERDKKKYNVKDEDLEGISNFLNSSPEISASLLLYEKEGQIKGSLRTERENIDVSALAGILGGGGHKKASGFKIPGYLTKEKYWQIK
jgi:phosphoesterase RecJ-like protein